jgi:hypothetical protein
VSAGVEERLRSELREREAPDEAAATERSWALAEAAFADRAPVRRRRRPLLRLALVTGLLAVVLAAVLTPAGAEVGEWLEKRVGLGPEETQPTLRGFPGGGRLLAVSDSGAWVVNPGGGVRRLGDYSDLGWSPRGLFVIGTRGHRITAMEPDGEPRWSFSRPGRLARPAWSAGDGFRIAYLERRGGATSVRVVDGSGGLDHLVGSRARAVTPAWRPGSAYVLTYATAAGGLRTVDGDSGRVLWRGSDGAPLQLAWTRDGRRLAALTRDALLVYSRDGLLLTRRDLPTGARALALALAPHPGGHRAAVSFTRRGVSSVVALRLDAATGRPLRMFTGSGSFRELAWSPSGLRLLVGWPEANQWLLIGRGRPRAFAGMSRQLDPGATGAGFPRLSGWCCVAR